MRIGFRLFVVTACLLVSPGRADVDLKFSFPYYSVGMIYDAASQRPIGSGFVFEDTRHVVTASHVVLQGGETQHELLFNPIKGINSDQVPKFLRLKLRELFKREDLALLEIDGPSPCPSPLTRGDADAIRVGDPVGYGGFNPRASGAVTFSISADFVRRKIDENGLHYFELHGIARPGFSGGPLFGGGTNVVGVILSGSPLPDGSSIFRAISIEYVPDIRRPPPPELQ